ncbi:peroxyureidoacrylate/ureidoacrylate amidohydrolase RutB [Micromonospora qiuiae]|uniref:Peroxyureidoacrylate/ureidoacrylate amidohydrolase RutB n=1 Tax=Micromonospora qiuiae TaxID=502268 RepID=A0ABQ4JEY2_9ACTN|nr:isochorismatase family cysteine hydrolase [Micromonospora qiuiae]GIJ28768.1 peroxyureidoacrylate/ureidoacrylate amidohydrolase RutB [Micromonospora qiuiae]
MRLLGPTPQNSWRVTRTEVDLRRPVPPSRPVTIAAEPQRLTLDLSRTVLLVVDMQNDFCHPDGWLATRAGLDVSGAPALISVIAELLPEVRAAGVPVVWLTWASRPDRMNLAPGVLHAYDIDATGTGIGEPAPGSGRPALQEGAWGTQIVTGLVPDAADIHVAKHRMSGFFDTPLDSILRNLRTDTVLFAGVNADQCVMATLTDAACLGYDAVLLEDAVGTTSPEYCMQATLYNVRRCYGFTATAAGLVTALRSGRRP